MYAYIDRNNLPGLFRTFDFPSPDSSSPGRPLTTVPQQALFLMNSPFMQHVSEQLSQRVTKDASQPADRADEFVRTVFARPASDAELQQLVDYLQEQSPKELAQALLMTNEFLFVD